MRDIVDCHLCVKIVMDKHGEGPSLGDCEMIFGDGADSRGTTTEDEKESEDGKEMEGEMRREVNTTEDASGQPKCNTVTDLPYSDCLPHAASLPRFPDERTPLIRPSSSFTGIYSSSWSTTVGPSPYTSDNKPKRYCTLQEKCIMLSYNDGSPYNT